MKDELEQYIESLYDKVESNMPVEEGPSPLVRRARKKLIEKAFEGDEQAKRILRTHYRLTYIYHNGKELYL